MVNSERDFRFSMEVRKAPPGTVVVFPDLLWEQPQTKALERECPSLRFVSLREFNRAPAEFSGGQDVDVKIHPAIERSDLSQAAIEDIAASGRSVPPRSSTSVSPPFLRAVIERMGKSEDAFAELIGATPSTLAQWLRGEAEIDPIAARIVSLLGSEDEFALQLQQRLATLAASWMSRPLRR